MKAFAIAIELAGRPRTSLLLKRMFPPIKSNFSVVYDCGSMG
jgi:hypothetical protein